ncbi:CitMHS family transporter [Campylobacter sputorum]|uniref:CitMHS family transporter n=1 Tax=Campylobacter sputorum TaxID=206 RepID=UPI00068CF890|nr:SLC13 family permease [Campylobacter sputorum]
MLTIFGFLIIFFLIYFLLKNKISPMVALIIVPFIGIILYWFVIAFYDSPQIPKNYAFLLKSSYYKEFVVQIAKENNFKLPTNDDFTRFYDSAFKALKLKPNVDIKTLEIDTNKLVKFYSSGINEIYPDTHNLENKILDLRDNYTIFMSIKDHAFMLDKYFKNGINKVYRIAIMFIFAILFFGVLNDLGLFNPIINFIIKLTGGNVIAVCVGTVLVSLIAHLDGSGATTFLIVIPPLIPVYKKLNMNPYLLFLLVASSAGLVNMLPWGGPLGRIASVLGTDTVSIYHPLIKVQIFGVVCTILMAVILGFREKSRLKNPKIVSLNLSLYSQEIELKDDNFVEIKNIKTNFIIAISTLIAIILGIVSPEFGFMIALCLVLLINYKTPKERLERVKDHAPNAIFMGTILLGAGVYIGILDSSGMLKSIAQSLANLFPHWLLPHLHIVVGFFGVPFELLLDTNGHYYSLFPVVANIVEHYGVSGIEAGYAIMIGSIVGTFVSPFSPALWLGLGLAQLNMGKHIKYSLFWLWGLSIIIMALAYFMGLF